MGSIVASRDQEVEMPESSDRLARRQNVQDRVQ